MGVWAVKTGVGRVCGCPEESASTCRSALLRSTCRSDAPACLIPLHPPRSGGDDDQAFVQNLAMFFTSFLKVHGVVAGCPARALPGPHPRRLRPQP